MVSLSGPMIQFEVHIGSISTCRNGQAARTTSFTPPTLTTMATNKGPQHFETAPEVAVCLDAIEYTVIFNL